MSVTYQEYIQYPVDYTYNNSKPSDLSRINQNKVQFNIYGLMVFCIFGPSFIWFSIYLVLWIRSTDPAHF